MSDYAAETAAPGDEFAGDPGGWSGELPEEWGGVDPQAEQALYDALDRHVDARLAPAVEYLQAHEERRLLAQGEARAQELLSGLGEGVDGFDETAVRATANETLVGWMRELASDGLRQLQYSPAAIDELLAQSSEEHLIDAMRAMGHDPAQLGQAALHAAAQQHGPRLGPHATVASAMFGRQDAPSQRPSSGLGNRPHAVTAKFFGRGR